MTLTCLFGQAGVAYVWDPSTAVPWLRPRGIADGRSCRDAVKQFKSANFEQLTVENVRATVATTLS